MARNNNARNTNGNSGNKRGRNKQGKRGKGNQSNNFQDKFADREYDKGERAGVAIETGSSDNDVSWYIPNDQLLKDVASFPTDIPNGSPIINREYLSDYAANDTFMNWNVQNQISPGVMVYYVVPTFGDSHDSISPISIAANALFTSVRQATSGTSYYETPDLMLYTAAFASAYSLYAYLIRLYGMMNKYSVYDRYLPKALVTAMGADFDDLLANKADFREYINTFAYQLAQFAIPKDINYITRQIFLYENVYKDANSRKAQYYMYNPKGFYVLNPGSGDSPIATLNYTDLPYVPENNELPGPNNPKLMKFSDIRTYVDDLIRPLMASQDFRYIQADFIKAFGSESMFKVAPIAETFTVEPVWNEEVLMQMENAFIYPWAHITATLTQNPGIGGYFTTDYRLGFYSTDKVNAHYTQFAKYYEDKFDPVQTLLNDKHILLNFHKDTVSPEDIMIATRLATTGMEGVVITEQPSDLTYWMPSNPASEIISGAQIFAFDVTEKEPYGEAFLQDWYFDHYNLFTIGYQGTTNTVPVNLLARQFAVQSVLSTFDWHPKVEFNQVVYSSNNATLGKPTLGLLNRNGLVFDLDIYARIDAKELESINTVAMLGLFSTPLIASMGKETAIK